MLLLEQIILKKLSTYKLASCFTVENHQGVLVVKANSVVIPKTQFQETFILIGQQAVKEKFHTIIIDKSLAERLDLACLQWYTMVWKELMAFHGLTNHYFVMRSREYEFKRNEDSVRIVYDNRIQNLASANINILPSLEAYFR